MKKLDSNVEAFLALIRAGLWEQDVCLLQYGPVDFATVLSLAEQQSVIGLVAAGLEHVVDVKVPKDVLLSFIGSTLHLEQKNTAMNVFVAKLFQNLKENNIDTLLVKGQGVAQCYERPLWRACGDVDLLLDRENYDKAKLIFDKSAEFAGEENVRTNERLHQDYIINSWVVEIHGTLHTCLSRKVDRIIDKIQDKMFHNNEYREWKNGNVEIQLPAVDNDIIFVFTHILQHFFVKGVGLRQICDLSRLLWIYKDFINRDLLELRINEMGLMTEWKAFGSLIIHYLGMPENAMPFYNQAYAKKSRRLLSIVLEDGNFGNNKDYSYFTRYPSVIRKIITSWRQIMKSFKIYGVFPMDSIKFFFRFLNDGVKTIAE